MQNGFVIVSNRLPISVKKTNTGLIFYPSAGGLATGLSGLIKNKHNKWIGWPGIASEQLTQEEKNEITNTFLNSNCYPVFLTQKQIDNFYNGYCNRILWPLFHNLAIPSIKAIRRNNFLKAYQQVNDIFASHVLKISPQDNPIWVHDYQLMLLPSLIRKKRPDSRIGFFLHIPFPTAEDFAKIPESEMLINGILGADLIGFHIKSYAKKFINNCNQIGINQTAENSIIIGNRNIRVSNFPMGIDYHRFTRAIRSQNTQKELLRLQSKHQGKKVIITVDRLDPAKGLVERVTAYCNLLQSDINLHEKIVMIVLAVPSRSEIIEYILLRNQLENLIDTVNAKFQTQFWKPIEYVYDTLPFKKLNALYQLADIAFVAPLIDGMNLVAKEYIASRLDKNGVLILSSTTGAAEELSDALIVEPSKPYTLVEALTKALSMSKDEQKWRIDNMQKQTSTFTVHVWADNFMNSLLTHPNIHHARTKLLSNSCSKKLTKDYLDSSNRTLLFDYDGVLAPFFDKPELAEPSDQLKKWLNQLAASDKNHIILVSGRSRANLELWFKDMNITLVAEHGSFVCQAGKKKWHTAESRDISWKPIALNLLEQHASDVSGVFVEQKETSLVWHYRTADQIQVKKHLVALKKALQPLSKKFDLKIEHGNMIVEVMPNNINKGITAKKYSGYADFVLAIGDDITDEAMFAALKSTNWTIKVGKGATTAHYRVRDVQAVHNLLDTLSRQIQ